MTTNIAIESVMDVMDMIKDKHDRYCTVTYNNSQEWVTYIEDDNGVVFPHQKHESLQECYKRFEHFYSIDDMCSYDKKHLDRKIENLCEHIESLECDLQSLQDTKRRLEDKI